MPCKKRVSADTLFCVSTAATDCKNKERKKTERDAEAACLLTFNSRRQNQSELLQVFIKKWFYNKCWGDRQIEPKK